MLAVAAVVGEIRFPVLGSPKLDGIRCLKPKHNAVTRSFKPIPNDHIRTTIEQQVLPEGVDGEVVTYYRDENQVRRLKSFNDCSGDVRRKDGKPDFDYVVFDYVRQGNLLATYEDRMALLGLLDLPKFCVKLLPKLINNQAELDAYEAECLAAGYEGVMIRSLTGPYKCGRASVKEGYLLKVKQFVDDEAYILTSVEMMHNDNVATEDAFGRTERSTHQENMRPAGVLGKFILKPFNLGPVDALEQAWLHTNSGRLEAAVREHPYFFGCGTGFTSEMRHQYWSRRDILQNKIVKFKHQPSGAKDKPRIPVFLGFRDTWDL